MSNYNPGGIKKMHHIETKCPHIINLQEKE